MDLVISADPPTPSPCPAPQRSPSYSHKLLAVVVSSDGAVTLQKVGKRAACGRTQPIIRQFHVHNVQSHFSPSSPPSPPSIGICASCLPLLAPASSYMTRRPVLRGLLSHSHSQWISSRVYTCHHTNLVRTAQIRQPRCYVAYRARHTPFLAAASSHVICRLVLRGLLSHSHSQRISSRVYTRAIAIASRAPDPPTPLLCGLPCPPHAVSCRCLLTYDL